MDQVLRNYGPEADGVRSVLRVYVDRVIRSIWPEEMPGVPVRLEEDMTGSMLDESMQSVLALKATNPDQVWLRQQALGTVSRLIQTRWSLLVNQNGTISPVILEVVVTWIMVIFASFGLNAPYNGTVVGAFLTCTVHRRIGVPDPGVGRATERRHRDLGRADEECPGASRPMTGGMA